MSWKRLNNRILRLYKFFFSTKFPSTSIYLNRYEWVPGIPFAYRKIRSHDLHGCYSYFFHRKKTTILFVLGFYCLFRRIMMDPTFVYSFFALSITFQIFKHTFTSLIIFAQHWAVTVKVQTMSSWPNLQWLFFGNVNSNLYLSRVSLTVL